MALAGALALVLAGCSQDEKSAAPAGSEGTIAVTWGMASGSSSALLTTIAVQEGIATKHGLDVKTVALQPAAMISSLIGGDADVTPNSVATLIQQRGKGVAIKMITAYTPTSNYMLVVPASDTTTPTAGEDGKTWKDVILAMKGKTISAAGGQASGVGTRLNFMFTEAGLKNTDWTAANLGIGAPEIAALQAKSVDAVYSNDTVARALVATGARIVLKDAEDGPDLVREQANTGFMSTEKFLTDNPDFGERIAAVVKESIAWMQDEKNVDKMVEYAKSIGMLPATTSADEAAPNLQAALAYFGAQFTEAEIKAAIEYSAAVGLIASATAMTVSDVATPFALG